jgi:hypothetical protein
MKLEKIRIFLYSWLPTGTYHKNLAIWNFFFQNLVNLGNFFFHEKSFVKSKSYFSDQNLAKIRQQKKH